MNQNANRMLKQIVELLTVSGELIIYDRKEETKLFRFLHAVVREMQIKIRNIGIHYKSKGAMLRYIDADKIMNFW